MKLVARIYLLLITGMLVVLNAHGQANGYLNILTQNAGIVNAGSTVFIEVTVGNSGPVDDIPAGKLRIQVSVPGNICTIAATGHVLPNGWTILSNSGTSIQICNSSDLLSLFDERTILISVQGNNVGGPSTIIGQLDFRNNCTSPGSLTGDDASDNSSTTALQVVRSCALTVTASAGDIVSSGGTTTLTATVTNASGTVEYSLNGAAFQSSNTFTVAAGTYAVTARVVNDFNCTAISNSLTIGDPSIIVATASAGAVLCNAGVTTLTVIASGGIGPLEYSLNDDVFQASNSFMVKAGTYTATVRDANLLTATTNSLVISDPPLLIASATAGAIPCHGETSTLSVIASGGTPPLQYSLNNGPYILENHFSVGVGTYAVTVSDAHLCTVATDPVTVAPEPIILLTSAPATVSPTVCTNAAITNITFSTVGITLVTFDGLPDGVTGTFSHDLITISGAPTVSGIFNYTIKPTPTPCSGFATGRILVSQTPDVNQPISQTVCDNDTTSGVTFSGSIPGTTVSWTNNTTDIGLAESGTGDIASFTANNLTNAPATATINVTPSTFTTFAYVVNNFAGINECDTRVSVVNTATNTIIANIRVPSCANSVVISPDASKVYVVTNLGLSVISTATNTLIEEHIGPAFQGKLISISPDGSKLYVVHTFFSDLGNRISVINTANYAVIATIGVGRDPSGIAITPDGNTIYVANMDSNDVSVISAVTNTVTATIPIDGFSGPFGLCISPDGSRVYVPNSFSSFVSVINTATNTVASEIMVGSNPRAASIAPDGSRLYVSNLGSNTISVINTATNAIVATISKDLFEPFSMSFTPDGKKVYVTNQLSDYISIINTATNTITGTLTVGRFPSSGLIGNFIRHDGTLCTGAPKTFTITVNPTPSAPTVGTIAQPVCWATTGSVALSGLPASGTWTLTRNPGEVTTTGTGSSTSINGLAPGTYAFSVTNSSGCVSSPSANIVINPAPTNCGPVNPNKCYELVNRNSGKVITIDNASVQEGTRVDQATYTGSSSQVFRFTNAGEGFYTIAAQNSGKVLTVQDCALTEKQIRQNTYTGLECQKWSLTAGGSYFVITNKNSGMILGVVNSSLSEGADVQQQKTSKKGVATNQQWSIVEVPCPNTVLTKTTSANTTIEDQGLQLSVHPNPSNNFFELIIKSSVNDPVSVRVMDAYGRVISVHKNTSANTTLRVGDTWINGIYFAEVIQGIKRKMVKMIKNDSKYSIF